MNLTNPAKIIIRADGPGAFAGTTEPRHRSGRVLLPTVSPLLLHWFTWYSRGYLRRHFHSVRVSRSGPPPASQLPLVIYSNHASWWDPLVGLFLKAEFFADRTLYAPIDAAMLERYRMFAKLGFFGVEQQSGRGAAQFLRTAEVALRAPRPILAVTPQGRFADVRERPVRFQAGLGHVATRVQNVVFVPLAVEYVFWEERPQEILVRFGEPLEIRPGGRGAGDAKYWTARFEEKLTVTLDALAGEAQRRRPGDFRVLLRGGAGPGGVYDWWRSLRAAWRGEPFTQEHGRT